MNVPFVDVHVGEIEAYAMPDIAKIVNERIANPAELTCTYDMGAIGRTILRQLSDRKAGPPLRLSATGGCIRALAYNWHNWKPTETLDAASRMNFVIGDVTEIVIVAAIKEALAAMEQPILVLEETLEEQASVKVGVPVEDRVVEVEGHPDGLMTLPLRNTADGSIESITKAVLEVKSMSDYGFKKFEREGLTEDDAYYGQIQAYMLASESDYAYVIAYGKTSTSKDAKTQNGSWHKTSPFIGRWIESDFVFQKNIINRFRSVITSASPNEFPQIPPNRKGQLVFPCTYCSHLHNCHKGAYDIAEESKWLQKTTKVRTYAAKDNS